MDENDVVELLWMNGQIVRRRMQKPTCDKPSPPPIFRGSGSGGGGGEEENGTLHEQPCHENLFIQEDEMASWLHHHPHFCSDLQCYDHPPERPASPSRKADSFMNFSRLRENLFTVEPVGLEGHSVVSAIDQSCLAPATHGTTNDSSKATAIGVVSDQTFEVPGTGRKGKTVAIEPVRELDGPSPIMETEATQIQIATDVTNDYNKKQKETINEESREEANGSTSRKRSRAAQMHNLSERRRREKINKNMKVIQELIPRCNKTDKASMLEDAIEYIKSLEMQVQMMSMGGSGMMSMMYRDDMQRFMPHMEMGMNRPPFIPFTSSAFTRPVHISPPRRYLFPNIQTFDPASNQPLFPGYLYPYSQFVGPHQILQAPPVQNQTTSQLSFSQASSSKKPEG